MSRGSSVSDSACWSCSPGQLVCSQPPSSCSSVQPISYRRDRFGESWHLVPAGELGPRGRSLCGEPRQGTRLSETYAEIAPSPPELLCSRCTDVFATASTRSTAHV